MRKLAIMLALSATLALAGSAVASLPVSGAFTGTTSAHGINGFKDLVTFTSTHGGRTLKQFQFGTLGCMGTGFFPVGVDAYALAYTQGTIASVPVSTTGTILLTAKPSFAETDNIVTSATIKASFANSKLLSGTIAITQTENGSTCGPVTLKFSAAPGTPQSLGLEGP
jgi:hypothetical protein